MTHPDWRCPGCNRPIEPIAAIRTYHAGCDPYARIERLEKALRLAREYIVTCLDDNEPDDPGFCEVTADLEAIDAALAEKGS